MSNASQDYSSRYPTAAAEAVVVNRPVKRTRTGGTHKGSRSAIIREARLKAPQFKDAAAAEIFFGGVDSTDTVVVFDPKHPVSWGF